MLSFLRKLLRVPPAKVKVNTLSSTDTVEKVLADYAPFVALTETSMEDSMSGREYEPPLFLASNGEDFNINKSKEILVAVNEETSEETGDDDTMKADGLTADWQDDVDWDSKPEPSKEWGVEWDD